MPLPTVRDSFRLPRLDAIRCLQKQPLEVPIYSVTLALLRSMHARLRDAPLQPCVGVMYKPKQLLPYSDQSEWLSSCLGGFAVKDSSTLHGLDFLGSSLLLFCCRSSPLSLRLATCHAKLLYATSAFRARLRLQVRGPLTHRCAGCLHKRTLLRYTKQTPRIMPCFNTCLYV